MTKTVQCGVVLLGEDWGQHTDNGDWSRTAHLCA